MLAIYFNFFFFHLPPMSQRKKSHSVFLIISDSLIYFVIGSETILQLNKHLFKLKKLKLSWLARTLLFKKKKFAFFLMKMENIRKMACLISSMIFNLTCIFVVDRRLLSFTFRVKRVMNNT
jgi:hypothetical protein